MMAINCKCPFDVNCQLSECPMCFIVFTLIFRRIMSELRTLTCWLGVWQVGLRGQRLVRGRLGPVGGGQRQQRGQHRGEEAGAPHGVSSLLTWSLVTVEYRHAGHSVQVCTGRGSRHNWLVTAARCRNWSAATTPRCSLRHTGEQRAGDSSRSPADTSNLLQEVPWPDTPVALDWTFHV